MTRNEWLAIWSDVQQIESNTSDLMIFLFHSIGPTKQKRLKNIVTSNRRITKFLKEKIQKEIGQLE